MRNFIYIYIQETCLSSQMYRAGLPTGAHVDTLSSTFGCTSENFQTHMRDYYYLLEICEYT